MINDQIYNKMRARVCVCVCVRVRSVWVGWGYCAAWCTRIKKYLQATFKSGLVNMVYQRIAVYDKSGDDAYTYVHAYIHEYIHIHLIYAHT